MVLGGTALTWENKGTVEVVEDAMHDTLIPGDDHL